jgi:hypothetical protein
MHLEGFLTQPHREPGTVALLASDSSVLAAVATAPNGRFSLTCADVPPGAALYGFPNLAITAAEVPEAISHRASGLVYEAALPVASRAGVLIYLNVASTAVCAVQSANAALTPAQADTHVKGHLFGAMVAKLMPGYSAGFLAHIAAPHVLAFPKLQSAVAAAGGWNAWATRAAAMPPPVRPLFATPPPRRALALAAPTPQAEDTAPSIPESANWAAADTTWMDVLSAEDGAFADSMQDLAETTDGVAASVTDTAFATTASDLIKWGAKDLAGGMISGVGSQLMSLVCSWVFSSGSSSVSAALQQIDQQLTTIVNNQATIIQQLSEVLTQLDQLDVNLVSETMTAAVANIQTAVQTASGYTTTTTGHSTTTLTNFANEVLDVDGGVVDSLQVIHDTIMGTGLATSLPAAVATAMTKPGAVYGAAQNFLSNGNCFATAQWLFHYYSMLQTQGVQLVIQAQNYQTNVAVSSVTTPLAISTAATAAYNAALIGGSGTGGAAPNLVQQRDLFRATFWPLSHRFQGLLGVLPDDMAVALLPKVANQEPGTIYYETQSGLIVLGHLSGKLRNWSAGTDVLSVNSSLIAGSWTLPPALTAWRYPTQAEFTTIFAPTGGLSRYGGWNLFQYFYDQGFTDDKADYVSGFSFLQLFTSGSGYYGDAWDTCTDSYWPRPSFVHPPFDINGNAIAANTWKSGISAWSSWNYNFQGTWPGALRADNTYHFKSSQCYNIYFPDDPSTAWADHPWFQISGGVIVNDAWAGYLPLGSYAASCQDIAVTFSCTAPLPDGSTTQVTFDLTTRGDVALSVVDGVVSVVNPYAPPLVNGAPAFAAGPRTGFLPPGNYAGCTNIQVQLVCQANNGYGYVPASFNLTPYTLDGVAIANTNGVLTG